MKTFALCALLFAAASARAEENEPAREHEKEHEAHHRWHVGAGGSVLGAFVDGGRFPATGGGVFGTFIAVPGRFELELSLRGLATEGGLEISQELLAKAPWHLTSFCHPFLGVGPAFAEYFVAGESAQAARRRGWGVGGALAVGADFWLNARMAVVVELSYGLLYRMLTPDDSKESSGALVQETGAGIGVLVGF